MVGHRSLGPAFNSYIYRRRLDVLNEYVSALGTSASDLCVLDLGCGNGFYAQLWQSIGVREYVGVDVSQQTIARLTERFPEYRFLSADLGQDGVLPQLYRQFDVVTLFDVIYHITDDAQALIALMTAARCLRTEGKLVLFDQVTRRDSSLVRHVKLRGVATFNKLVDDAGLAISGRKPLFALLAPPTYGIAAVDFAIAVFYKLIGSVMKRFDRFGLWMGKRVYELDQRLIRAGVRIPNHEAILLVRKGNGE